MPARYGWVQRCHAALISCDLAWCDPISILMLHDAGTGAARKLKRGDERPCQWQLWIETTVLNNWLFRRAAMQQPTPISRCKEWLKLRQNLSNKRGVAQSAFAEFFDDPRGDGQGVGGAAEQRCS